MCSCGIVSCLPDGSSGHSSSQGQGLSATLTSPPEFPSDKPNKPCFFSLISQLTSDRLLHGFFPLLCQEVVQVQVKWERGQESTLSGGCPNPPRTTCGWKALPICGRGMSPVFNFVAQAEQEEQRAELIKSQLGGQGVNVESMRDPVPGHSCPKLHEPSDPNPVRGMGFLPQRWGLGQGRI